MTRAEDVIDKLTDAEQRAIRTLKRLARNWPDSLWLFSASGSLCVMRNQDGQKVHTTGGGFDPEFMVDEVDIPNDGGDW